MVESKVSGPFSHQLWDPFSQPAVFQLSGGIAYPDASNVIDESLGSCCSLVVERFAAVSAPRRE